MFHQNATNTLRLGRLIKEYRQSSGNIVKVVVVSLISGIKIDVFFIEDGSKGFRTRLGLLENAHVLMTICEEMSHKHQPPSQ